MRWVSRRCARSAGVLAAAALMGPAAMIPRPARAGQAPPMMPMVLPQQSLPSLQQLNEGTSFTVVCVSQAPVADSGNTAPTAVVDLSPPAGAVGPDGSFPMFLFPQDVPTVQQLNGGMAITPVATFQMPAGGAQIPITQVTVSEPGSPPGKNRASGCLLVCPVPTLPLLGQLNPGLQFQVVCTCQIGAGKPDPAEQTALLNIQPAAGSWGPSQPLPILLPVDVLPRLGQLNAGATLQVIDVTEVPAGGTVLPVALVDVQQNPQALTGPSPSAGNGNSDQQGDDDSGKGDGSDEGSGKGHGKGHGHDHGEGDDD